MILVDTSVWIDHLGRGDETLVRLLEEQAVLGHPWIRGELVLGNLNDRDEICRLLSGLPQAPVASIRELDWLVEHECLVGRGIGFVDAQLLASTRLVPGAQLWTRDKRLAAVADALSIAYEPPRA